jgi:hypothetical protein
VPEIPHSPRDLIDWVSFASVLVAAIAGVIAAVAGVWIVRLMLAAKKTIISFADFEVVEEGEQLVVRGSAEVAAAGASCMPSLLTARLDGDTFSKRLELGGVVLERTFDGSSVIPLSFTTLINDAMRSENQATLRIEMKMKDSGRKKDKIQLHLPWAPRA